MPQSAVCSIFIPIALEIHASDAVVLPAGTDHYRLSESGNHLVVGAYRESRGRCDQPRPKDVVHGKALAKIAAVPAPVYDPVYGRNGPQLILWR